MQHVVLLEIHVLSLHGINWLYAKLGTKMIACRNIISSIIFDKIEINKFHQIYLKKFLITGSLIEFWSLVPLDDVKSHKQIQRPCLNCETVCWACVSTNYCHLMEPMTKIQSKYLSYVYVVEEIHFPNNHPVN